MKQRPTLPIVRALFFFAITAVCAIATASYARAQISPPTLSVTYPSTSVVSPHLSDLPQAGPAKGPLVLRIHPRKGLPKRTAGPGGPNAADQALQTKAGKHLDAGAQANFPGLGENGYLPPDTNIAVGPNHIVETVNVEVAVFNKSGTLVTGFPKNLGTFWNTLGGSCTNAGGDPVVQYDKLADRFVITQLAALSAPYAECIAVSTSSDPTGSYYQYSYSFGSNLPDYPKFGVWPTTSNPAYLGTYNLFANGVSFVGADLCAYDRTAMLTGKSAAQICATISNDASYLPVDLDGSTAPIDGTPGYFLTYETNSSLRIWTLAPNFASPASAVLTQTPDIAVASFSPVCGGGTCVPQPGTTRQLDSLADRLMYRLAYRRFAGDHQAMVVNHSVVVANSGGGVRWYELRKTDSSSSSFSLFQQGTFAPDSNYRWMGSIAMDQVGDMGLGYSLSNSSSIHPSLAYTARLPGDAAGLMESETIMQAGAGSQTGYSRWGDYSAMRIDPTDDCTFWYANEYYTASSSYFWSTAIGSFKLSNCTGTPDFTISASASPLTFTQGTGGTTTSGSVALTSLNGFNGTVTLTPAGACGTNEITCTLGSTLIPLSSGGSANSSLSIVVANTTPANSYTVTINGSSTSPVLNHSTSLTLVVSPPVTAADFAITPSATSITVKRGSSGSVTYSISGKNASSSVSLSVSGVPSRTSGSFSPNPVTTSTTSAVSSKLTIKPNWIAPRGTYPLTITGNNGIYMHNATLTLTIN